MSCAPSQARRRARSPCSRDRDHALRRQSLAPANAARTRRPPKNVSWRRGKEGQKPNGVFPPPSCKVRCAAAGTAGPGCMAAGRRQVLFSLSVFASAFVICTVFSAFSSPAQRFSLLYSVGALFLLCSSLLYRPFPSLQIRSIVLQQDVPRPSNVYDVCICTRIRHRNVRRTEYNAWKHDDALGSPTRGGRDKQTAHEPDPEIGQQGRARLSATSQGQSGQVRASARTGASGAFHDEQVRLRVRRT